MAAVARNNSSASFSFFLDIDNLEVVENAEENPHIGRKGPDRKAEDWNAEVEKRIVTRKEDTRLSEFEDEGLMAQNGLWDMAKRRGSVDRGAVPEEEGDLVREHKVV